MIRNKLITLPRLHKRLISLTVDVLIIWLSVTSAFLLRVGWDAFPNYQQQCLQLLILAPVIVLPINIRLGLYRSVLRYMNSQVAVTLLRVGALSVTGIIMATYVLGWQLPRSLPFLFALVLMLFLGISRYAARYWLLGHSLQDILLTPFSSTVKGAHHHRGTPVAVYGAGDAGCQLVSALDRGWEYRPVLFVDDDPALTGRVVYGRKVYHSSELPELVGQHLVDQILLALPSLSNSQRKAVISRLDGLNQVQ